MLHYSTSFISLKTWKPMQTNILWRIISQEFLGKQRKH
uniref:Uncharacterized protein n=1 Tax=Rhizophora mucronata TaxID=61149 RepID=A0A2P2N8N8_RHIMU